MRDFEVIAFDIDGTLYPAWKFNLRIIMYFISHFRFFLHYRKVRKVLHRTAPLADFKEYQARLMSEELKCSVEEAHHKIDSIIYDGLSPYFSKLKPFKNVLETFQKLHEAGYRLALMSDFPPEQKGEIWGVLPYCELVIGTEKIGALKPSKYPFGILSMELKVPAEKILYVGNSIHYDVNGAKNAGMKTAYLNPFFRRLFHVSCPNADIIFSNYRQFQDIVLK